MVTIYTPNVGVCKISQSVSRVQKKLQKVQWDKSEREDKIQAYFGHI